MSVEKFESSPIIFGDFIKVGADPSDRLYEELADMKKISSVLNEVWIWNLGTHMHVHKCIVNLLHLYVHVYMYFLLHMYILCI